MSGFNFGMINAINQLGLANPLGMHDNSATMAAGVGQAPDRLVYPSTLETENDEHTHFIVFHIWGDKYSDKRLGGLDEEQLTDAVSLAQETAQIGVEGAAKGAAVGGAGAAIFNRFALRGIPGGWGQAARGASFVLGVLGGGAAGYTKAQQKFLDDPKNADRKAHYDTFQAYQTKLALDHATRSDELQAATGQTARFGEAINDTKETIAMYMPQKIQNLSLLEYEQLDMSFMQGILNDKVGLATNAAIGKLPGIADTLGSFIGLNTNIDSALLAGARMAANPRKQLVFREPVSRKFEFQFNFSPRSEEESVLAYQIIKRFKMHAYPKLNMEYGKGAFYTFPAEFEIEYHSVNQHGMVMENDWINKIGRCALREINVDYASSGSFSTFNNGAPTNMTMSLTFEEMSILNAGRIEEGY